MLLGRFAASRDATAFGDLVRRYLPLVYAAARRRAGDPGLADDICQAVFLVLAEKAASLRTDRPLGEWLLTVTRYAAANAVRQRGRRAAHERAAARPEASRSEAVMPPSELLETAEANAVRAEHLDAALDRLSAADRRAVLLRFYNDADYADVATALDVTEAAARRRVTRAVEKLRSIFARRGVSVPAAVLMAALPATLAVTPPPALAASISVAAVSGSVAAPAAAVLAKGTLKTMMIAKLKIVAAATLSVVALAGTGTGIGYLARAASPAAIVSPTTKPYVGWIRLDFRGSPSMPPEVVYVEPSTDRRAKMDGPGTAVSDFTDPVARVSGRLLAEIKQFHVGNGEGDRFTGLPYSETKMLDELKSPEGLWTVSLRPPAGGERVFDVTADRTKLPPGAGIGPDFQDELEIHVDAATGLLKRVIGRPTKGGPALDMITAEQLPAPPFDLTRPETLPLPAGIKRVDNRPPPEMANLMKRIDAVVDRGLGFETGVVVTRLSDPHTGEFAPDCDEVTVCSGGPDRFVIATWALGKPDGKSPDEPQRAPRPNGWPKPKLESVIAAVGGTRPNRFIVYDGTTCWANDYYTPGPRGKGGRTVRTDPKVLWCRYSIVGKLWCLFPPQSSPLTSFSMSKSSQPEGSNRVILSATSHEYYAQRPATQPALVDSATVRMTVWPELGPYPLRIETETSWPASGDPEPRRTVVDVSPSAGWMFRDPVRVPDHWRTLHLGSGDPPLTQFDTLIPSEKGQVPEEWFADPAVTWPKTGK